MNNTPNSGGRKKKVGQGNGNVGKRKPAQTNGPVGREDGYSGRNENGNEGASQNSASQNTERAGGDRASGLGMLGSLLGSGLLGSSGSGSSGSSGSNQSSSSSGVTRGGLGKILLIILVIAVGYFLLKSCMGGTSCSLSEMMSGMSGLSGNTGDITQFVIPSEINNYDASDSTAQTAISASTSTSAANLAVSSSARDKYTTLKGNGNDKVTIMVFMCGTDLESKYGMATNDLNEMLHARIDSDKVNVIVETGGTKTWKNNVISNSTNQRWKLTSQGLIALDKNLGRKSMVDPNTLSDFIKFCKENYPADRYMLIFWDHGGGSLTGYGYDQNYSGSMDLSRINKALYDGGVKFDFIGFDACLMATLETATVIDNYADYLIASEETEPGCGWYYTNWLTELSSNTSINTVTLAKTIIDDFNDVCKKNNAGDSTTLSITDLAEFHGTVPNAFKSFASGISSLLDSSNYQTVASARSGAREFGASAGIDHIDVIHFASRIGTTEAKNFVNALQSCIKYNRTSKSMTNAYGMSIYFPYKSFSSVNSAVKLYNAIGVDSAYSAAIKSFASLAAGGQIATGTTSSPLDSLFGSVSGTTSSSSSSDMLGSLLGSFLGGGSSSSSGSGATDLISSILGGRSIPTDPNNDENSWFEADKVLAYGDFYDSHAIYGDDMILTEKNGGYVLSLTPEKWDMVQNVQLNVFLDDGEGYIDLGMDNIYQFDNDGDLMIDYDRTWIAIDGQVVPYYMISEVHDGDDYVITGRVPAMLNGELVYIIIVFDNETEENEYGYVAGARYIYEKGETDLFGRGLIELKDGDKLEFICDYYSYSGEYQASYYFGEPLVINGEPEITNVSIGTGKARVCYCLTDIYNNEFWTLAKEF